VNLESYFPKSLIKLEECQEDIKALRSVKEELKPTHIYVLDQQFHDALTPPDVHSVTSCVCLECQMYITDIYSLIDKKINQLEQQSLAAANNSTLCDTEYTGGSGNENLSEGSKRQQELLQKKVDKIISELYQ